MTFVYFLSKKEAQLVKPVGVKLNGGKFKMNKMFATTAPPSSAPEVTTKKNNVEHEH